METLYYNRGRLALISILCLTAGLFFVYFWVDPSLLSGTRRAARLFNGGFGRYFFVPLLTATCLAGAWLTGTTAFGDGKALDISGGEVTVTTLWGRKRISLRALRAFGIERSHGYPHLVLEGDGIGIFGGSTLRLPLGAVRMDESQIPDLLETIARHSAASATFAGVQAPATAAETAPPAARRPAFGRKVA